MVKVLSNGEVVSDDDPRARRQPTFGQAAPGANQTQRNQNQVVAEDNLTSLWNSGNDRLRRMGLETFHVAGYRIDPIHLVAAVLGFLLSGPMMLAVVIALILISQSRSDNTMSFQQTTLSNSERVRRGLNQGEEQQQGVKSRGPFSGTGQKLGS